MSYSNARKRSLPSAAGSGSPSRLADVTASRSRSRCATTTTPLTSRRTVSSRRRCEGSSVYAYAIPACAVATAEALASFDGVTDVNFDTRRLPTFNYTRLDERYRPVLELAALLVQNTSVDLHPGGATTSSILFDMNDVFEDFVWAAIGDELRRILPTSYRWRQGKSIALDEDRQVRPEPDLSLWDGQRCVFVGDAKYKETERKAKSTTSISYSRTALPPDSPMASSSTPRRPGGSEHPPRLSAAGRALRVETVDLTAPVDEVQRRCRLVASEIAATALAAA